MNPSPEPEKCSIQEKAQRSLILGLALGVLCLKLPEVARASLRQTAGGAVELDLEPLRGARGQNAALSAPWDASGARAHAGAKFAQVGKLSWLSLPADPAWGELCELLTESARPLLAPALSPKLPHGVEVASSLRFDDRFEDGQALLSAALGAGELASLADPLATRLLIALVRIEPLRELDARTHAKISEAFQEIEAREISGVAPPPAQPALREAGRMGSRARSL